MGISLKDSFQIQTSVRPAVQFQSPLSPDLASIGTQNMQKMGEGLQALGKGLVQADVEALNKAANLRIKDNLNKLDQDMFDLTYGNPDKGIRGYTDFKGGDIFDKEALNGMPLQSKYSADYENKIGEYEATLPDYAKQKFREQALSKGLQLKQNSMLWADKQAKQYEVSVYQDLITNTSFALAKAQTPEEANQLLLQLDEGYTGLGVVTGQGVDADKRKAISNSLSNATYNKISEGDLNAAMSFYSTYKDQFEIDDAVRVDKAFQTANKQAFVNDVTVFAKANLINQISQNGDLINANFGIIEKIEGGVSPEGVALVSSKGAIGVSQILPTTAKEVAQKNNIPFDENRLKTDKEYNRTLGLLYYKEQLKTFDNDFLKAGIAYNGGPGVVKKAMQQAESDISTKANQGITVADPASHWQNFLEYDESKKYLEKLKQNTPTQFGKKTFPSEDQFLSDIASKSPANLSLEQQKEIIDTAKGVYKLGQIEYNARQDSILGEGMSAVKMGQNIDVLKFQELSPENQEKLNKFASNQRQGKNIVTNPKVFSDFINNSEKLKNTDLNAFADQLNPSDLNFLESKQKELITAENDQIKLSRINSDTTLINQQIKKNFNILGFETLTEKDPKYIKLYQQLSNLLSEAQISKGKDLTQQETIALLNQATSRIIFDSVTQIPLYGDITRQKETTAQNFNAQTDSIVLSPKNAQEITTIFQLENKRLPQNDAELKDFYLSYKRRAGAQ